MKKILLLAVNQRLNEYDIIYKFNQNNFKGQYIVRKDCNDYFLKYYFKSDNISRFMLQNEIEKIEILDNNTYFPKIVDFRLDDNFCYLIEERILGMSLTQVKKLTNNEKIKVILKILKAIKIIHSKNIIHCDLKPENIIITTNYDVKIIDFEISKLIDEKENFNNNYGSLKYASPEQIKKEHLDIQTDIYSIGIIISELLIGNTGFENLNSKEVYKKKLCDVITEEDLSKLKLQDSLLYIIKKATCLNKKNRYKNIDELYDDLLKVMEG